MASNLLHEFCSIHLPLAILISLKFCHVLRLFGYTPQKQSKKIRNKKKVYILKYMTFKKNDFLCKKGTLMRIFRRCTQTDECVVDWLNKN